MSSSVKPEPRLGDEEIRQTVGLFRRLADKDPKDSYRNQELAVVLGPEALKKVPDGRCGIVTEAAVIALNAQEGGQRFRAIVTLDTDPEMRKRYEEAGALDPDKAEELIRRHLVILDSFTGALYDGTGAVFHQSGKAEGPQGAYWEWTFRPLEAGKQTKALTEVHGEYGPEFIQKVSKILGRAGHAVEASQVAGLVEMNKGLVVDALGKYKGPMAAPAARPSLRL